MYNFAKFNPNVKRDREVDLERKLMVNPTVECLMTVYPLAAGGTSRAIMISPTELSAYNKNPDAFAARLYGAHHSHGA